MRLILRFIWGIICLTLFTASHAADNLPARKAGLWEIKMQSPQMPQPMLSQHCIDEKTDNLMQQQSTKQSRQQCSKNSVQRQGDRVIIDSVCNFDGTTATTHGEFSGDFTRNYRGEISTSFNPPLHGMKNSKQTFEGKWLGACKPGQKPGDVIMPGMGSMNLNDIMKNMPKGQVPR